MSFKNKKGQIFSNLAGLAIALATFAIVMTIAFLVISKGRDQIQTSEGLANLNVSECRTSAACNATRTIQDELSGVPSWLGLIVVAFVGSLLLGLIQLFRNR